MRLALYCSIRKPSYIWSTRRSVYPGCSYRFVILASSSVPNGFRGRLSEHKPQKLQRERLSQVIEDFDLLRLAWRQRDEVVGMPWRHWSHTIQVCAPVPRRGFAA